LSYGRGYQTVSFGPPVTPHIIKVLLIANLGVFILQHLGEGALERWFALWPVLFWQHGHFWQAATYMWLHAPGSLVHIGFNMLALWMFGSPVAAAWGERAFLRFYLICGIGAGFVIAAWPALPILFGLSPATSYVIPTLGASGAVFGVLLAYSLLWPDRTIMLLFPPIPIKAIYFIPLILGMGLLFGPANVSHIGHLGGVLVGYLLLRRMGIGGGLMSLDRLRYKWRRWRMRRNLRAVRMEEMRRDRRDDDRTFH
jgi:membrane associated rhomboid family serine protease